MEFIKSFMKGCADAIIFRHNPKFFPDETLSSKNLEEDWKSLGEYIKDLYR